MWCTPLRLVQCKGDGEKITIPMKDGRSDQISSVRRVRSTEREIITLSCSSREVAEMIQNHSLKSLLSDTPERWVGGKRGRENWKHLSANNIFAPENGKSRKKRRNDKNHLFQFPPFGRWWQFDSLECRLPGNSTKDKNILLRTLLIFHLTSPSSSS